MIAITEKKLCKYQPYKSSSFPALQSPSSIKGLATAAAGKEGSSETRAPIRRQSPAKVEEHRKKNISFKCDEPFTLATAEAGKKGSSKTLAPIRRLSPTKVAEYRKKNICFKCDEPFTFGHKCQNKSLVLIECDDMKELAEERRSC